MKALQSRWSTTLGLLAAGLLAAGVLVFLYQQTHAIDPQVHNRVLSGFTTLKEYEAVMDRVLFQTRSGLHPSYDPLVDAQQRLHRFAGSIGDELPVTATADQLRHYLSLLRRKADLIEEFKSQNAILTNSLTYFPVLCHEFLGRDLSHRQMDTLVPKINRLLESVLVYMMKSTPSEDDLVRTLLDDLSREKAGLPVTLQQPLSDILIHGNLILRFQANVEDTLRRFSKVPTELAIDRLRGDYLSDYQLRQEQVDRYHNWLIAISALCIASVLGALAGLAGATAKLRNALRNLEFQQFALDQHAIVSIADVKGRITYANQKFRDISGYSAAELLGRNHRIVKSDHHTPEFYQTMWRTIARGEVWHGEIMNRAKNGNPYWVASTIVPSIDTRGKPFQYVSIRTDISRRKAAEERLREEREFLSSLTDTLGDGVYVLDTDGRCTFLNPEGERLLGWSADELLGRGIHNLVHNKTAEGGTCAASDCPIKRTVMENRTFRADSEVFLHRDGTAFPVSVVSVPLNSNGRLSGSVTIFRDISEQKHREQDLRQARDEAERASRAKSEFLSSMSHELRTPMNAILGFAQLMQVQDDLSEENQEFVGEILKAGRHLLELINEVLDLAKIEAGRIDLFPEAVDCLELLDECLALTTPLAADRGISVQVAPAHRLRSGVWGDRTRFKQVLINLLSNAIKYNREGGSVDISLVETVDDRLQIRVKDTGPGIPQEQQQGLFEPFTRAVSDGQAIEGTGIGLVISRRLAQIMGGALDFESSSENGSCFWVELPRTTLEANEDAENSIAGKDAPKAPSRSHTVLYVEDNPANLKLVEVILSRLPDLQLLSAPDPELGLDLARGHDPDLIILDINMPKMNGFDVLRILRDDPVLARKPVFALSANAMPQDMEKALEAGFDHYLTKPIDVSRFLDAIREHLD
jgi:two-component system sensor histidine kinase/response regulator